MMNYRRLTIALAATAAFVCSGVVRAAASLDELLNETRNVREAEMRLAEQRKSQFNSASAAEQTKLMNDATRVRDERAAAAEAMSDRYSENEIRINGLNQQLRDKANTIGVGELFGLARQVASDAAAILQQSMISAQLRPRAGEESRDVFLRRFSEGKSVPTPPELERIWQEILREMTESGKVSRFNTELVQPNGSMTSASVIRVGPFLAISDSKYLGYLPALQALHVLPRQPSGDIVDAAERLRDASSGYVSTIVDPSRGVLMGMYVERPNLIERIHRGDVVVAYTILTVGAFGTVAFIYQLFYLFIVRFKLSRQLRNLNKPSRDNPLGRVLMAFKGDPNRIEEDAEVAELRITEAVLHEVPKLERFQALLRLSVAAGPLLGLIGTVVGMIMTFQSITETGSSDPKIMAAGIGTAMIATVLGLGIAIPLLFANAWLNSLSRGMVQILDEQSAGMLAESLEKRRRA
jgi:biopolymer transport protein ExbB